MIAMIRVFPLRPRNGTPEQTRRRRRADALALIAEEGVRSYPSWIAELRSEWGDGIDRCRYAYEHLGAGDALELVRERTGPTSDRAVSYYHRAVHLGYVPKQHHWIAAALDDGLRLAVIVEKIKPGWIRRRAKFVGTRIVVVYDGR
jgi:HIRAN domain-containing protein